MALPLEINYDFTEDAYAANVPSLFSDPYFLLRSRDILFLCPGEDVFMVVSC